MKRVILLCLLCQLFINAHAQTGIQFEKGLTWPEIRQKAKAEHKYIFVDCYATWCGPCKMMDQQVYPVKEVGDAFNKKYISVKIQMDRTPSDNEEVKNWYWVAKMLEKQYIINAYPTLLFFNSNGEPVHKIASSLGAENFIKLAADAQKPDKQYYTIVKNFQPGKLDTAELKGLARMFLSSNKELADKMAVDYLTRIPKNNWNLPDNQDFMIQFQDNPQVLDMAVTYTNKLNKNDFSKIENLRFIAALSRQTKAYDVALAFITGLTSKDLANENNGAFVDHYQKELKVKDIIKGYINNLSEEELYARVNIVYYLSIFTEMPVDRGFTVFYQHPDQIDAIVAQKGYAQSIAEKIISNAELKPLLDAAEEKMEEPDFDVISTNITNKYSKDFAERIVISGRLSWYSFLARTKKEEKYWPEYISSRIAQVEKLRTDTMQSVSGLVNDISYEIFKHCDDTRQLNIVAGWMKKVVSRNARNHFMLDTYACVLYRAGRLNEALDWESKALRVATEDKSKGDMESYARTIDKMKKGEMIWLQKEYQ